MSPGLSPIRVLTVDNHPAHARRHRLVAAKAQNDASVRQVIDAARAMSIAPADIETDYMQVSLRYDNNAETVVNHYIVTKDVQILLRSVDQFEELLSRVLLAGANHIYDIDFSTSELRKHRDAARALAMKAAPRMDEGVRADTGRCRRTSCRTSDRVRAASARTGPSRSARSA